MDPAKIALIGDEPNLLRTLRRNLVSRGYEVHLALDDREAYDLSAQVNPDLFVLNLDFSTVPANGLEVCACLRSKSRSPIIVLSADGLDHTKVQALDHGADDYVVLPFSMDEFLARVRSVLRRWFSSRLGPDQQKIIFYRDLLISVEARQVSVRNQPVHLTPHEFDILVYLAQRAGKVVTHRELLKAVWGDEYGDEREYLRVFVSQLRRKIEADPLRPVYLITEAGVGYRFTADGS